MLFEAELLVNNRLGLLKTTTRDHLTSQLLSGSGLGRGLRWPGGSASANLPASLTSARSPIAVRAK